MQIAFAQVSQAVITTSNVALYQPIYEPVPGGRFVRGLSAGCCPTSRRISEKETPPVSLVLRQASSITCRKRLFRLSEKASWSKRSSRPTKAAHGWPSRIAVPVPPSGPQSSPLTASELQPQRRSSYDVWHRTRTPTPRRFGP